ncbi:unnamed protein product [Calypogeia fissa]
MSRDEAQHAGFFNKRLSDFGLALDLGFLTQDQDAKLWSRFFCLSNFTRLPLWDLVGLADSLHFHLWESNIMRNYGSFLRVHQGFVLTGWKVYVTMYLNDVQRTAFYEGSGLNTRKPDMHVIFETNRTSARGFPAVPDVENPEFKVKLDHLVELN